jgi:phenylalanyl-tRNA synthetase beta chain
LYRSLHRGLVPVVKFDRERLVDAVDASVTDDELAEALAMLGCVPEETGAEWAVEVFPDRPDLLSAELLARALRTYLGDEPGLTTYGVAEPEETLVSDASVEEVRPVIVGGRAGGVDLDEDTLTGLMDLQEDLHWGLGARRRKVSVGIHDAAGLTPPYTYKAVDPDEVSFVPLKGAQRMTMREMTSKIEKGVEFAHLVEDHDRWPLIVDDEAQVLSFPPIINGTETTVTVDTDDVFVDVTGTDERACREVLTVVMAQLAELGGELDQIEVVRPEGSVTTPQLDPSSHELELARARSLLGGSFAAEDAVQALERMGHGAETAGDELAVEVPAWRSDVLHEVDLVEDVAIGIGYDRFTGAQPTAVTYGEPSPGEAFHEQVRRALAGFGYLECLTLTLRNREEQTDLIEAEDPLVAVQNPVSQEQEVLRRRLVPCLLDLAAENTHRDLPQQLFEVGEVVVPDEGSADNEPRVAGITVDPEAGFTDAKQHVEGLLRALAIPCQLEAAEAPGYIEGRCAAVHHAATGDRLGTLGEVHPATLEQLEVTTPVAAFELCFTEHPEAGSWGPETRSAPASPD